jgi:hypothetical protein
MNDKILFQDPHMKTQSLTTLLIATLVSAWVQSVVKKTIEAMQYAYKKTDQGRKTSGLAPSEIAICYNLTNEADAQNELRLAADYATASIGDEFGLTQKSIDGNTVTLKFTRKK